MTNPVNSFGQQRGHRQLKQQSDLNVMLVNENRELKAENADLKQQVYQLRQQLTRLKECR